MWRVRPSGMLTWTPLFPLLTSFLAPLMAHTQVAQPSTPFMSSVKSLICITNAKRSFGSIADINFNFQSSRIADSCENLPGLGPFWPGSGGQHGLFRHRAVRAVLSGTYPFTYAMEISFNDYATRIRFSRQFRPTTGHTVSLVRVMRRRQQIWYRNRYLKSYTVR